MIGAILSSLTEYSEAYRAMSTHKLWKYAILPGLLSVLVAGAVIASALTTVDDIAGWTMSIYPFEWGKETITGILEWFSGALMIIVGLFLFRYVVMIVASPFMGTLSEKVESIMTGKKPEPVGAAQMMKDVVRGIRIALRNIIREVLLTVLLTIAGFIIPVIGNIITTVLIFVVQAYYAGFGNMDYTLERKRFSIKDSVAFVNANRGIAVGNGTGWLVLMLIPVVGWFLAPVLGTVTATKSSLQKMDAQKYSLFSS